MSQSLIGGLAEDRASALRLTPVSRETEARLEALVELLLDWQQRVNLVAPSTLPIVWTRHIADSLQLLPLAGEAQTWVDLGSGGGFPALVIGCALAERTGTHISLVESTGRKVAFLREAVRILSIPATVHLQRIEEFGQNRALRFDVVSARALAPMPQLMRYAYPMIKSGATGLFLKGQDVGSELTEASKYWNIKAELIPSLTESRARIVKVTELSPRGSRP